MKSNPIVCTIKAQIQAMTHWKMTIFTAHGPPSSLLIEAIAATQGVYNKQNIKSDNAPRGVSIVIKDSVPLNNTESVETTLSLAINPHPVDEKTDFRFDIFNCFVYIIVHNKKQS